MNKKRIVIALFAFYLFFNHIFGNLNVEAKTTSSDISGEITFAAHKTDSMMLPYLKEFMNKYPNVKVHYLYLDNYEADIADKLVKGEAPDVFFVPAMITYENVDNYLEPLGRKYTLEQKYNYLEKCMLKNGYIYNIPSFAYILGILYNEQVFEKAGIAERPVTMEEFLYDCQLIKEHTSATPLFTNYTDSWAYSLWNVFPYIEMNGISSYRYNEFLYDTYPFSEGKSSYRVFKFLYDLIDQGYTESLGTGSYGAASADLARGNVASMVIGSWAYKEIQKSVSNADKLGFMPFPNNIDGEQYATVLIDYSYGINKFSENKEAAKAFVEFMLDESGYALDTGNISILNTDPYVDFLGEMSNTTMLAETTGTNKQYSLLTSLQTNFTLGSTEEIGRIMRSAGGLSDETFDEIMNDWNTRWESGRPADAQVSTGSKENLTLNVSNDELKISEKEKEYIQNHPTLRVGYLKNFAPFSYEDGEEAKGLYLDVYRNFGEKLGFQIEYYGFDNEQEGMSALNGGRIDIFTCMGKFFGTKVSESKNFYQVLNVYVMDSKVKTTDPNKLNAVFVKGDSMKYGIKADSVLEVESPAECIQAIADGKADYTIMNYNTAEYYLQDLECSGLNVISASEEAVVRFCFAANTEASLVALVNKYFYTTKEDELASSLLQYSIPPKKDMTFDRILKSDPMFFIQILLIIFGFIVLMLILILFHRHMSNRRLAFEMKKYTMLGDLAEDCMFDVDYVKQRVLFDKKFQKKFGFDEFLKITHDDKYDDVYADFMNKLKQVWNHHEEQDQAFQMQFVDGEKVWHKMIISVMKDKHDKQIYAVGKLVNVQKEMEEMQNYQERAEQDSLTGILNRRGFIRRIPESASDVLYIMTDVDDFKKVNDTLGHAGGDQVLCLMADRMRENLGEEAIIGRFGGDEFVAILADISEREAKKRLEDLVDSMNRDFTYEEHTHHTSISIGAAYSAKEILIDSMFTVADEVLYERKAAGKNGYNFKKIM